MGSRTWDVVLYGATGFTGKLAAEYLAKHAPADLRIALAGRSADKLSALKASLSPHGGERFGTIVASGDDMLPLAKSAKVVITTAGPYALYGEPLIRACAQASARDAFSLIHS